MIPFLKDSKAALSDGMQTMPPRGCGAPAVSPKVAQMMVRRSMIRAVLGRTGIVKNKEATDRVARISLYCWMASSACAGLVELGELKRLSRSMRKLARELRDTDKYENEQYQDKMRQSDERLLALVKAAMDVVVAVGLLQLAPKKVTPRVTGAFGFVTSLISCYQQLPSRAPVAKVKV